MTAIASLPGRVLEVAGRDGDVEGRDPGALLVARGLSVRHEGCEHCAVEDVWLSLAAGERVAVVGPSGGGKTTLLRALEGALTPAGGVVERHGPVALVHQDLRLVAEASVLDNVCAGGVGGSAWEGVGGWSPALVVRARGILEDLGLLELAHVSAGSLSGGQRQRLAIARALCAGPRVLLADEPMASLDPENALRILRLFARLQERHRFALVLSIHDPGPAPDFFHRVLVVRDGRCTEHDPTILERWQDMFAPAGGEEPMPGAACQDRSLLPRPGAWAQARGWMAAAAIAGLVAWSALSLDLAGASLRNAGSGLLDFLRALLPGSLAEAAALPWAALAASLLQTIQMALVGTALGAVVSLPLALMASGATAPAWLRLPMRFGLNMVRTVPSIIWALAFVAATGLGPLAGVLALAAYSCGYLTKFFYESLEDADGRSAEALRRLGASRLQAFVLGIWPAGRAAILGSTFFVFEYNIRAASVLGIVGAGGIGADLVYHIEWRQFPSAAAGLLLILVVVVALDAVSRRIRKATTRARGV